MNKNIISGTGLALVACLFVATIILVNATLTDWRLDLTENKLFTLSDGTINIINELEEPITLDFYFSQKELTGYPALTNYGVRVRDMLLEYKAHAGDKIDLNIIDPEPFSEEEDQAVAAGLQGIAINNAGDRAYFGLVGTNSTDDERVIPFFQASKEGSLEYDITKLVYNLAHPKKRVIGIISSLPVFGEEGEGQVPGSEPWTIIKTMREFFEVRDLGTKVDEIDSDVDVLMVIHPKNLQSRSVYAIDQYVLAGGKAMIFVDPLAEADRTPPDPDNPATMPDVDSDLPKLLDAWGVDVLDQKVAGDINAAMHVQTRGARGPKEISYLPWLRLAKESFNQEDFATSELSVIHMGTSGIIEKKPDTNIQFTPLVRTTKQSMRLERDFLMIQRDPSVILDNFKSAEEKQILVARLQGTVSSAFPGGIAEDDAKRGEAQSNPNHISKGDINVIVSGDTDILSDLFWIRNKTYFGMELPQPIADNGNLIVNSLENLSGSNDLINLRSRGEFTRPFERVEAIRRQAELKFREREQKLQAKLQETEEKIKRLQQEQGNDTTMILTPEQNAEMEKFRKIRLETRKELRSVQHELRKDIEALGTRLKLINIGLIPTLIILIALGSGVYRVNRRY